MSCLRNRPGLFAVVVHVDVLRRSVDEIIHGDRKVDGHEHGVATVFRFFIRIFGVNGRNIAATVAEGEGIDILLALLPSDVAGRDGYVGIFVFARPVGWTRFACPC